MRHIVRHLIGLACLAVAAAALAAPAAADRDTSPPGGWWLPFDAGSPPGEPVLSLVDSSSAAIGLRAEMPGCRVQEVKAGGRLFSRLYGPGYGTAPTVGLPDLPVLRRDVEIPVGAQVTLEIVAADYVDRSLGDLGLDAPYPVQPPVPKRLGAAQDRPPAMDEAFYGGGSLYPSVPVSLGPEYVVRGHRVQTVEVWPVGYDPAAGTVRLYRYVTVRLRLAGSDLARTNAEARRYASPAFERRLSRQILNYNQAHPSVSFGPSVRPGYLIITADAFHDAMLPFVDLKTAQGFDVTMVTCIQIGGCTSPTAIQTFIRSAYNDWPTPPSYLLLVGDTNAIPAWIGPGSGDTTDVYYAGMDGTGTTDWHPDLGRGRFPVRTPEQATIMVDKYLAYAALTGQEPWLKKAAFVATCDQSHYSIVEATHDYVIATYTQPKGYTGIFPANPQPGGDKIYCHAYGGTTTQIRNAANDGRWAVVYSGHGSETAWADGAVSFSQDDVRGLTGTGFFPFVAGHACLTGDFGADECLGETWVRQAGKGALVYWGASDLSYWGHDDVLERAMFDELFDTVTPDPRVAEMTDFGLSRVEAAYAAEAQYYWEIYNVLGDPAMRVFLRPDTPSFVLSVDPETLSICKSGTATTTVTIDSLNGYNRPVSLRTGPLPDGVTARIAPAAGPAPFTAQMSLNVAVGTPAGEYTLVVTATDDLDWTQQASLDLTVLYAEPDAPPLLSPADGATDESLTPALAWSAVAGAATYRLQLGPSPILNAPDVDAAGLVTTSHTPALPLLQGRCYWWRAAGENACSVGEWGGPFHFRTVSLDVGFSDGMEAGAANWTHGAGPGADAWQISTAQAHDGAHAWFVPDSDRVTDTRLWIAAGLAAGHDSTLSFWHLYQFEGAWDGAVLEISTNGGQTWADLGPHIAANGYNGTIASGYDNPLGGRSGWTGDLTAWTRVEVDLDAYAGQTVMVRWRLGCDSLVGDVGWYIDDVEIVTPQPPGPAPSLSAASPATGTTYLPTPLRVEGAGFVPTPALRLGSTWLVSVTLTDTMHLSAVVPPGIAAGVYPLILYNGDCQEAVLADAFTVTDECPTPEVSFSSDSPREARMPVHFSATGVDPLPLTYSWDFGGPGYGFGEYTATPLYFYAEPGTYTVGATAKNICGNATTAKGQVEIVPSTRTRIYVPVIVRKSGP